MGSKKSKRSASKGKQIISRTEKPWGHEELMLNQGIVGMKRMVLKPKHQTSYHYHNHKNEVFFIESGKAIVRFESGKKELKKGEFVYIPKQTKHQTYNPGPAKLSILEFGSPHAETDVVRVEDPYAKTRASIERVVSTSKSGPKGSRAAVFLDRDGVINDERLDYVKSWSEFVFKPKAKSAIRQLNNSGYLVIVVTNQSCISKGIITKETLNNIHRRMEDEINMAGGHLDAIYYCPHRKEDNCDCRKPRTGMVEKAAKTNNIDLSKSWLVGDSIIHDVPLGKSLGLKTILIPKPADAPEEIAAAQPDYVVDDLMRAVQIIKGNILAKK